MTTLNGGPSVFLSRLMRYANFPSSIRIYNSSIEDCRMAKAAKRSGHKIIARLDGTTFYRLSPSNLYAFMCQRDIPLAFALIPFRKLDISLPVASYCFNHRLMRCANWFLSNADGLVFQSALSRQMYKRFLQLEHRLPYEIINNGVDLSEFSPKTSSHLRGSPSLLISASVHRPHKRLQEAIKTLIHTKKHLPSAHLHILGDLDPVVGELVRRLPTSHCTFHGRKSISELPAIYAAADIFLSPSLFDPCPNVVCEALASGLPVLTTSASGAAELIQNNSEWIISENVPLHYTSLQDPHKLPIFPVHDWAHRIISIHQELHRHRTTARQIALQHLDIRHIADQYSAFASRLNHEN